LGGSDCERQNHSDTSPLFVTLKKF
jgi:hypothetical protein